MAKAKIVTINPMPSVRLSLMRKFPGGETENIYTVEVDHKTMTLVVYEGTVGMRVLADDIDPCGRFKEEVCDAINKDRQKFVPNEEIVADENFVRLIEALVDNVPEEQGSA